MSLEIILSPINGQTISASTTSARNSTAFKRDEINVYSSSEMYIKFGDSTVTVAATAGNYDMYLPAGSRDLNTRGKTHMAVILVSGTATVHVNEWTKKTS